jgi:CBS domain-containing protein
MHATKEVSEKRPRILGPLFRARQGTIVEEHGRKMATEHIRAFLGLMAQHQLDRLLVMEGDRLVGIISEADIRSDEGPLA